MEYWQVGGLVVHALQPRAKDACGEALGAEAGELGVDCSLDNGFGSLYGSFGDDDEGGAGCEVEGA